MDRRVFLSALSGSLLAAPLAAEAQKSEKTARVVPGPGDGDCFNIKKEGGIEPDLWVRLYRLEF
jgi:hypothetical protein